MSAWVLWLYPRAISLFPIYILAPPLLKYYTIIFIMCPTSSIPFFFSYIIYYMSLSYLECNFMIRWTTLPRNLTCCRR